VRGDDKAGDLLEVNPSRLLQLPPLHTILRGGKRSGQKNVPVTLAARCTEIGTLELSASPRKAPTAGGWSSTSATSSRMLKNARREEAARASALTDVWPEEQVQEAAKLIRSVYDGEADALRHSS